MLKKIILFTVALSPIYYGCDHNLEIEGKTPGVVSLSSPGIKQLVSYDVGEIFQENIYIAKGGLSSGESTVEIIVDSKLIDSINTVNGTSYIELPQACYSFESNSLNISGLSGVGKIVLNYNPDKILELSLGEYDVEKYALPLRLKSVKGFPVKSDRSSLIYTFKVSNPILKILDADEKLLELPSSGNVELKTNFGVLFPNKWKITATIDHPQSLVDAYNQRNNLYYSILPEQYYTGENVVEIAPQKTQSELSYTLDVNSLPAGNYAFPIQINGITSSLDGNVTDNINFDGVSSKLFLFSKKGNKIPKTGWTIVSTTTEETTGEGPANGRAIHLIDDKLNTFWHSKWQGGSTALPYEIIIDMGQEHDISQLEVVPRNVSNNSIVYLQFETSLDKMNWTPVGKFNFDRTQSVLSYPVKKTTARYIKLMIPEDAATTRVTAIMELTAFGN